MEGIGGKNEQCVLDPGCLQIARESRHGVRCSFEDCFGQDAVLPSARVKRLLTAISQAAQNVGRDPQGNALCQSDLTASHAASIYQQAKGLLWFISNRPESLRQVSSRPTSVGPSCKVYIDTTSCVAADTDQPTCSPVLLKGVSPGGISSASTTMGMAPSWEWHEDDSTPSQNRNGSRPIPSTPKDSLVEYPWFSSTHQSALNAQHGSSLFRNDTRVFTNSANAEFPKLAAEVPGRDETCETSPEGPITELRPKEAFLFPSWLLATSTWHTALADNLRLSSTFPVVRTEPLRRLTASQPNWKQDHGDGAQPRTKKGAASLGNASYSRFSVASLEQLMCTYRHQVRRTRGLMLRRKSSPSFSVDGCEESSSLVSVTSSNSCDICPESNDGTSGDVPLMPRRASCSLLTASTSRPDPWPPFVTGRLTNSMSPQSRMRLFWRLSEIQSGRHTCSDPACADRVFNLPEKATQQLKLISSGFSIPKPGKPWGGEDAFFFMGPDGSAGGVADGVGEWVDFGINPRLFSEQVMIGAEQEWCRLRHEWSTNPSQACLAAMESGFKKASETNFCYGAATAVVAGLNLQGNTLGVANLGDSGVVILRRETKFHMNMTVLRRTKEQQHFFNCPFQLSSLPKERDLPVLLSRGLVDLVRVVSTLFKSNEALETDTPSMADLYDIKVKEGDLIVIATDGLLDNLFDAEVAALASQCVSPYEANILIKAETACGDGKLTLDWLLGDLPHPAIIEPPTRCEEYAQGIFTSPQDISRAIAEAGLCRSLDIHAKTPFGRQARKAGYPQLSSGGKMDDVTVVAMWVVDGSQFAGNIGGGSSATAPKDL